MTIKNNERLGIWALGINLARRLRLPAKLGILCAILAIPLLVVAILLLLREAQDLSIAKAEVDGMKAVKAAIHTAILVQKHRGQTALLMAGNKAAQTDLLKTRTELSAAIGTVKTTIDATKTFDQRSSWQALEGRLKALSTDSQSSTPAQSFVMHSDLVRDLRYFVYNIADVSGLLYDPETVTYLLMDMSVSHILPWTEQIGRLRGLGSSVLAKGEVTSDVYADINARNSQISDSLKDLRFSADVLSKKGESGLALKEALDKTANFVALTTDTFKVSEPITKSDDAGQAYFTAGTDAIGTVLTANDRVLDRLQVLLNERVQESTRSQMLLISGVFFGFAVLVYVIVSLFRAVMIDMRRLSYTVDALAQGNLRVVCSVRSRDEFHDLAKSLDAMKERVSVMVANVCSNAALVAHAGSQLSVGGRDLAVRTELQATNLEQTSASVQDLASTVQRNANTAEDLNRQALKVREIAEEGAKAMSASVAAVEAIQQSAQRMDEIVSVIDGLAFQTNILALNAAVEAARAGETGRGFAVVASEVRSLAQRSAGSAREIRALIHTSNSQVEDSVTRIRSVGDNIQEIAAGIRTVATGVEQISSASAEQSNGLREVSIAVTQLDEITQRNLQMVEQAVQHSELLERQAASLGDGIDNFQLLQGVASEAVALVNRAVSLRNKTGTQDSYLRELTAASSGLFERDMYVFALDYNGTYRAFAGNLAKVGTKVQDVPGIDGERLVRSIMQQIAEGPGWVEYDITNPATGAVQTKMSYVQQVDQMAIGCGVYKNLV